jgi:excisionase family DNA binding protein
METTTTATSNTQLLTVSDAARMLGVHSNTIRNWTDQGVLKCLRINRRGDRRYARQEIARFLAQTQSAAPAQTGNSTNGLLTRSAALAVRKADTRAAATAHTKPRCRSAMARLARPWCYWVERPRRATTTSRSSSPRWPRSSTSRWRYRASSIAWIGASIARSCCSRWTTT